MDEVTWGALTAVLTVLGGAWTWFAFRNRGAASGTRGVAFTLLPAAAWLTGTLEMFTEIGASVADWATHLVLSPVVWLGIGLAGLSLVLFVVSGVLRERQLGTATDHGSEGRSDERRKLPASRGRPEPAIDDDLADIEALLRKRGIT